VWQDIGGKFPVPLDRLRSAVPICVFPEPVVQKFAKFLRIRSGDLPGRMLRERSAESFGGVLFALKAALEEAASACLMDLFPRPPNRTRPPAQKEVFA
jgi:hypothetical protein